MTTSNRPRAAHVSQAAILVILIVGFLLVKSLGAVDMGIHLALLPADGRWLCYDNDPRLEPHATPDANDHVCSDAEIWQSRREGLVPAR